MSGSGDSLYGGPALEPGGSIRGHQRSSFAASREPFPAVAGATLTSGHAVAQFLSLVKTSVSAVT